jgi:hypothetical protein
MSGRAGFRRLVIRSGSSPIACADTRPTTLQEAKPEAGSIPQLRMLRDADRRRERSPEVERRVDSPGSAASTRRFGQARRKSIGRDARRPNDTWARNAGNGATPIGGNKPARGAENPGALPGAKRKEGGDRVVRVARPGRECPVSRSGTPRRKRRVGA